MNPFLVYFLITVGSYAVNSLLRKPAEKPTAAAFDDFDYPQVEEGTPQAVIFGDVWSDDWTIVALGNFSSTAVKTKSGKK